MPYSGGGATTANGLTWPVSDATFSVDDNGDGNTLMFQLSGLTGDIIWTASNNSMTVAGINVAQNFSASQGLSSGNFLFTGGVLDSAVGKIGLSTAQTPDAPGLWTGTTSNSWIIAESADQTFDFGHAQQTNPTLFIHSANQSTTEYNSVACYGTKTEVFKALTAASATTFATIAVASGSVVGGTVTYCIYATDGTDHQSRSGVLPFSIVNKADTETGTVGTVGAATEVVAVSSGTLTNTFTIAAGTNAMSLQANAASSLTETTLRIYYSINLCGPGTVTLG